MPLIAGHVFDNVSGLCSCGRKFSDISGAEYSDVGKMHFAHAGCMTQHEFDQIVSERERLYRALTGAPRVDVIGPISEDDFSG